MMLDCVSDKKYVCKFEMEFNLSVCKNNKN